MNLRRVFLICFTAACLPGVAWSGWSAWQAVQAWSYARLAVSTAEAMGLALRLADALTLERGTLIASLLTQDPSFVDLPALERANDALLDKAEIGLRRAGLSEAAATRARDLLGVVRVRVAEELRLPLAARDPRLSQALEAQMNAQLRSIRIAVDDAEGDAAAANARIGMLIGAGSLGVELRDIAGMRSVIVMRWVGGLQPSAAQVTEAAALTGRLQHTWEQLQRQVGILGRPARLVEARNAIQFGFFREAERHYEDLLARLRAGEPPPLDVLAYRRFTIMSLSSLQVFRDAAIGEAIRYGQRLEQWAEIQIAGAGLAALGLVALWAGSLLVLLNRLVLPVQRLTEVITRLAAGDVAMTVPVTGRRDEIAAMAAAIEVFRCTAVALRQTNLRFDAALQNMGYGLAMYDKDDRLVVINERLFALCRLPPDALRVGMTSREVVTVWVAAGHFPGRSVDDIIQQRRGAGSTGEIIVGDVEGDRAIEIANHAMQDGGWIATVEDVTERREAGRALREANDRLEQRVAEAMARHAETEEALRQSQKMEAVGQLTGGIAHDFNNMLASISASLEVMQMRIGQGRTDRLARYIDMAQGATRRASALTHRLLAFSRRQTLDPRPTDVNHLVADMEEMLGRSVGPAIRVDVETEATLWPTLIDPSQLENALLNLCINARDAMPDGGRLTIETMNREVTDPALRDGDLPPGDYVVLRVCDTGTGMPAEVIARAFDPFFTTKPIGQGTGLGLSMIYGFTRQSGGTVTITSQLGEGTQVCLYLPRHTPAAPPAPACAAPGARGRTVLVVDDEPMLRSLMAEALEESGYDAIACSDGTEGLRVLASGRRIDLLITDVGLPGGMNGRQLADAARETRPRLAVMFMTGLAESAVARSGLETGMEVLPKPFAIDALTARVATLMAAQSTFDAVSL